MPNVKISQLPEVNSVLGTDVVPVVASSATSKITVANLAAAIPQVSSSISASYSISSSVTENYDFKSSTLDYYVDKRFTGSCQATINSNKTISSENQNYLFQLSSSIVGNPNKPFPDPWSATLHASSSIASGQITSAKLIIKTGNLYTYGSSTLNQNGDITGSLTNNTIPDISVSQANYTNGVFYLIQPNIEYYFEDNSSLYNINKSWQQILVNFTSSDWNIAPKFNISGCGKFVNVYGQNQGFVSRWGIIEAPRAEINISANHIIQNMWQGWELAGQKIKVNVDKWWAQSGYLFQSIGSKGYNWPSQSVANPTQSVARPVITININELRWGDNLFGGIAPPANDLWGGMELISNYGADFNINIDQFEINVLGISDAFFRDRGLDGRLSQATASGNTYNININSISGSDRGGSTFGSQISQLFSYKSKADPTYIVYDNMYYRLNIKRFESSGIGIGNSVHPGNLKNSYVSINCDEYINYGSIKPESSCIRLNTSYIETGSLGNNTFVVSGNYKNYQNNISILSWGTGYLGRSDNPISNDSLILSNFIASNLATSSESTVISIDNAPFGIPFTSASQIVIKDAILIGSGSTTIIRNRAANPVNVLSLNCQINKESFSGSVSSTINIDGMYVVNDKLNILNR